MEPRPYQGECVEAIRSSLFAHDSTIAVLPTGCGKTVIFALVAREWPRWTRFLSPARSHRVLFLAHREELVTQAQDKVGRVNGEQVAIEMAESSAVGDLFHTRLIVGSVATMCRPRRLERYARDFFGLIVVDEAHHSTAASYRTIFEHFGVGEPGGAKLLGVTATPQRGDGTALGKVYQTCAYQYAITTAIDEGYLVPVRCHPIHVDGLDFSNLRSVAGDFVDGELEAILLAEKQLHEMAKPILEVAGDRQTLVFCAGVAHAEALATVLARYKPRCAKALSGSTEDKERRKAVADFGAARLQILCNCALFLEGFDSPRTSVVVMGRPTKSVSLYTQVLGRGTRTLSGLIDGLPTAAERKAAIASSEKPYMTVLDFVGNSGRHKIASAADVLGGNYSEPVRRYATEIALNESTGPVDPSQLLDRAVDELALLEEENQRQAELDRRRKIQARRVSYTLGEVDPFEGGRDTSSTEKFTEMASPRQCWKLKTLGYPYREAQRLSKRQASNLIGRLLARQEQEVASE